MMAMQLHMTLAMRDVGTFLHDVEGNRRNGCDTSDVDALKSRLAEALAEIRELNSDDMKTLRRNLERAEIKIDRLDEEIAEIEDDRDEERDRANGLDDDLSDANEKIEDLESKVADLEASLAARDAEEG